MKINNTHLAFSLLIALVVLIVPLKVSLAEILQYGVCHTTGPFGENANYICLGGSGVPTSILETSSAYTWWCTNAQPGYTVEQYCRRDKYPIPPTIFGACPATCVAGACSPSTPLWSCANGSVPINKMDYTSVQTWECQDPYNDI